MRRLLGAIAVVLCVMSLTAAGWPTNHGNNLRSGYNTAQATYRALSRAFGVTLDGAVYGSPIVVGSTVIVATENNTVYGLNSSTGARRWSSHLRSPVTDVSRLACAGNIAPSGITGTPAYDAATNRVFVVTLTDGPPWGVYHEIWGLNATTGGAEMHRRLTVPGTAENALQQRAALATANGNVYIAFGGLAGDCGNYKGGVISLKASGALGATAWVVPTAREAGIWAPGGPVVAADGSVYVAIGNGASTSGSYDGSDSVTRLSPTSRRLDYFAPASWASDNAQDLDLGSLTPAFTANGLILQAGKSGLGYVLRASRLGGINGQLSSGPLCRAFGVSAVTYSTVYLPCTTGVSRVEVLPDGRFTTVWTAAGVSGSPVVGPGAVYSVTGGVLYALSGRTGARLGSLGLGAATTRFATPALAGNKVYVGTTTGVVAVNVG